MRNAIGLPKEKIKMKAKMQKLNIISKKSQRGFRAKMFYNKWNQELLMALDNFLDLVKTI